MNRLGPLIEDRDNMHFTRGTRGKREGSDYEIMEVKELGKRYQEQLKGPETKHACCSQDFVSAAPLREPDTQPQSVNPARSMN